MDPYQQQTGQFTQYVQPYQGYSQSTTPTAYYPQYQSYQQQPYAAYHAVPGTLTAPQTSLGLQTPFQPVGYYAQPTGVAPVVQATNSVSTATSALPQPQPTLLAGALPVSTAQQSKQTGQLNEEQHKYIQQYQQWQQQYQQWLQQNQNHPDQKQFQQWQQQMQNWQQQYSQIIPAEKPDDPNKEDTKQQDQSQQVQQPPLQQQTTQQQKPPQLPSQSTSVMTNPTQTHGQTVSHTGSSELPGGYSQQPHYIRQQPQQFGSQLQPLGHQAQNTVQQTPNMLQNQNMGLQTQNRRQQTQNMGQQSQNIGHLTQSLGSHVPNMTNQNMGRQNQNVGHPTQNRENQIQNIQPQNQAFGHQAQDMGHKTPNMGYQSQLTRYQTPNVPPQNQQTGYQSQSMERLPSSASFINKPSSNQEYTHPDNQEYNSVTNKPPMDQPPVDQLPIPYSRLPPGSTIGSPVPHQQDYPETSGRDVYQHDSKNTVNETEQDMYHHEATQPPPSQYHVRPIQSQFNQQNRFSRPPEGLRPIQSPRPYRQFRPESIRPREGLHLRETRPPFPSRSPRPRGPMPRGSRPPFPDQMSRFRPPRPPRPNLCAPHPQFEYPSRQQSPGMRPPARPFHRPPAQNFNARGPRLQEPRLRHPAPYENQDHIRPQQSIRSLSQPETRPAAQPLTQTPAKPSARPQTQALTRPPAQSLSQPPGQPLTRPPPQPLTHHPAKPLNQSPAQPLTRPPAQQMVQPTAQPLAGAQKQPTTHSVVEPSTSSSTNKTQTTSTGDASMSNNKTTEIQSNNRGNEKKLANLQETSKDPLVTNLLEKADSSVKQESTENEAAAKPQPVDTDTLLTSNAAVEPGQDKAAASLEIEILKRQQDQLNKLKELEILQRNQKAKQEETKDVMTKSGDNIKKEGENIRENRDVVREAKQAEGQFNEGDLGRGMPEKRFQPCRNFPDCGPAEECEFHHPLCKFDSKCKKPDCPYWHTVPLHQRYSGKKILAIQEGRYFEGGIHDIPEHPPDFDERDSRRAGDPYDAPRPDYDRILPEDPYYERKEYPLGPPDDYREYYDDRALPPHERDEFDRRRYDEFGPRDRFDRRTPPPRIDRELERDRAWRVERFPPLRDYERYHDEPPPFRDRIDDRGLDPYERDLMYRDADREYYDRLRERDLRERDYDRRYEDDPIFLEREREWRRELDRRRDPYDDPYQREPIYDSRERRPPYDFPQRYPDDFDRRCDWDRDLFDERLDARRPWDREFRHPDDDLSRRDRYLDERDTFHRREAFDYNHGGKSDPESDRYTRRPRETPPKPKPKPKVTAIGTLLDEPGRETRPERIVFIFRGVPGSGKTHIARLIKDKELACGAPTPRILSLDDYFLQETSIYEKDPETGKKVLVKGTEYVYEAELEESYRNSLFKAFNKTLDDGFFPMVILDCVNNKVEHFERFWSQAKQKGFEVYVAELNADPNDCAKRNTHHRTLEEINEMLEKWEETPTHHTRLDVRSLLQDAAITEVEMEAIEEPEESKKGEGEDIDAGVTKDPGEGEQEEHLSKSRWDDVDVTELQLDKLDGLRLRGSKRKTHDESPLPDDDDDDPYDEREEDMRLGKKRVRWADIEERKHLEHRRRIGFCIGTDWSLFTNPDAQIPQ